MFLGTRRSFRYEPGVVVTEVGYTGGKNTNPTYQNHPGHAEAIKITYDPKITSYQALLDFFFRIHDPTTKDRQGNDVGSSYRSAIFYENSEQKAIAQTVIKAVNKSGIYSNPVVTTLEPLKPFTAPKIIIKNIYKKTQTATPATISAPQPSNKQLILKKVWSLKSTIILQTFII